MNHILDWIRCKIWSHLLNNPLTEARHFLSKSSIVIRTKWRLCLLGFLNFIILNLLFHFVSQSEKEEIKRYCKRNYYLLFWGRYLLLWLFLFICWLMLLFLFLYCCWCIHYNLLLSYHLSLFMCTWLLQIYSYFRYSINHIQSPENWKGSEDPTLKYKTIILSQMNEFTLCNTECA